MGIIHFALKLWMNVLHTHSQSAVHNRHLFIAIINLQGYDILLIFLFILGFKDVKDHVWQIIHFAWGIINQLNKSGVFNEGQATHHSFLNETFFLRPIIYCLTSFCTTEGTQVFSFLFFFFQRGFIFQHTFVRELLLGNVLFKTEIFVQTWSVIIGCANFEENNWEHLILSDQIFPQLSISPMPCSLVNPL